MKSGSSLMDWRDYFRAANSDIFEIIDHAIMVAAVDCPNEFKLRRDRIAERLFSSRLTRCSGCEKVELLVPCDDNEEADDDDDEEEEEEVVVEVDVGNGKQERQERGRGKVIKAGASKESKVNSSGGDDDDQLGEMDMNMKNEDGSNFDYGLEALTDEIEEESQIFGEVMRIKEIFEHNQEESDAVLLECLRKLQFMALSVETLKATEIGKAVNRLRKHGSVKIRELVRALIDGWKLLVDEWVNATAAIASTGTEGVSDTVDPSSVDQYYEEGLPTPPLDEGAFFATPPASMELSEFFDGMEDYGNPSYRGPQFNRNRENGRRQSLEKQNVVKREQEYVSDQRNVLRKEIKSETVRVKQEVDVKPYRPSNTNTVPRRPSNVSIEQNDFNNARQIDRKPDRGSVQKRQLTGQQQDKLKHSDESAAEVKLEATKRKLQESYQQVEKAKRQRTVQVMELHDIPKQGLGHRNPHFKSGNHNRQRAFARRF